MRSPTTCTEADAARQTPLDPRPTATKLATVWPGTKLSTDVAGIAWPHGHAVRKPGPRASVAVRLSDTAVAPACLADGTASASVSPGFNRWAGAPTPLRVSSTRTGAEAVAWAPAGPAVAVTMTVAALKTTTAAIRIRRIHRPPHRGSRPWRERVTRRRTGVPGHRRRVVRCTPIVPSDPPRSARAPDVAERDRSAPNGGAFGPVRPAANGPDGPYTPIPGPGTVTQVLGHPLPAAVPPSPGRQRRRPASPSHEYEVVACHAP